LSTIAKRAAEIAVRNTCEIVQILNRQRSIETPTFAVNFDDGGFAILGEQGQDRVASGPQKHKNKRNDNPQRDDDPPQIDQHKLQAHAATPDAPRSTSAW